MKVDQEKAEEDGVSPLYVSCKNGHFDAARLLLDNGAAVDRATVSGWMPLHAACFDGRRGSAAAARQPIERPGSAGSRLRPPLAHHQPGAASIGTAFSRRARAASPRPAWAAARRWRPSWPAAGL